MRPRKYPLSTSVLAAHGQVNINSHIFKAQDGIIRIEVNIGERAVFQIPAARDCHNYTLLDPHNTAIFYVNRYGSNLLNWASNRAEFSGTRHSINLAIKSAEENDGGDYQFISGSNKIEPGCVRTFHLVVHTSVDGGWSKWSTYGPCSVTCEGGIRVRHRECSNPAPAHGGRFCVGSTNETVSCYEGSCTVDGGWSEWSLFGPCSVTCGEGTKIRTRECSNPLPSDGGKSCVGLKKETSDCFNNPCKIDGGWSEWSLYGPCSVTCGKGTKIRTRDCSNPLPSGGGRPCAGQKRGTSNCLNKPCKVDGGWSEWSPYGPCSVTCGEGTKIRTRECSNPLPSGRGKPCVGQKEGTSNCLNKPCKVDGGWSEWSPYGPCSVTCGEGTKIRIRECSNPLPSGGGKPCVGQKEGTSNCLNKPCKVHGVWSTWSEYGRCSVSCGEGTKTRFRECTYPESSLDDVINCTGRSNRTSPCYKRPCPAATDLESQIIGVVGGLLAVVLIAAIAVVVVLWKKYKKGTGHINQETEMQSIESPTVENHTYFEAEADAHIYCEIPAVSSNSVNDNSTSVYEQLRQTSNHECNGATNVDVEYAKLEPTVHSNSRVAGTLNKEIDKVDTCNRSSQYLTPVSCHGKTAGDKHLNDSDDYITPISSYSGNKQ